MTDTLDDFWQDRRVKIGYETAEELAHKFNDANWRGHPEEQADALDDSLETLQWIGSVKLNIQTGRIFDGHLRVTRALVKNPQMPIPVDYYDLSPDEEMLALQIHDAITEQAQPIPEKLAALLERTRAMTADKPGLAAMLAELQARAGVNGNTNGNGQEPETPTETEAAKLARQYDVQPGQVWQLGRHLIACIDSTDEAAVKELIGGGKVGMVWADPPYGMELDTDYTAMNGSGNNIEFRQRKKVVGGKSYPSVIGDSADFDPSSLIKILSNTQEQFWWGADYYAERIPDKNNGSWLVWDKRDDNEQFDKMFGSAFELCWSRTPHKRELLRVRWCGVFGTEQEPDKKRFHPTQKPVNLALEVFTKHGQPADLIFDPFLGSGPSILAAENLNDNRRVIGCELAPEYIAVTIFRWESATRQQSKLLSG